jgi:hypothetical protein
MGVLLVFVSCIVLVSGCVGQNSPSTVVAADCGTDSGCLKNAEYNCLASYGRITSTNMTLYEEIHGSSAEGCNIFFNFENPPLGNATCTIPSSVLQEGFQQEELCQYCYGIFIDMMISANKCTGTSALIITPITTGRCTVNKACTVRIAQASGGQSPYTFQSDSFATGAPPMGMIVSMDGSLTGTPSKEGNYNFGICVKDATSTSKCTTTSVTVASTETASGVTFTVTEPEISDEPNEEPQHVTQTATTTETPATYSGSLHATASTACDYSDSGWSQPHKSAATITFDVPFSGIGTEGLGYTPTTGSYQFSCSCTNYPDSSGSMAHPYCGGQDSAESDSYSGTFNSNMKIFDNDNGILVDIGSGSSSSFTEDQILHRHCAAASAFELQEYAIEDIFSDAYVKFAASGGSVPVGRTISSECPVTYSGTLTVNGGGSTPSTGNVAITVARAGTGVGIVGSDSDKIQCGNVVKTCGSQYTTNQKDTLNAQADSGSWFAGWSAGCNDISSRSDAVAGDKYDHYCDFTADKSKTLTAKFMKNPSVTISNLDCTIQQSTYPGDSQKVTVMFNGTAYGSVEVEVMTTIHKEGGSTSNPNNMLSCGSWTKKTNDDGFSVCKRMSGQPDTTEWSALSNSLSVFYTSPGDKEIAEVISIITDTSTTTSPRTITYSKKVGYAGDFNIYDCPMK